MLVDALRLFSMSVDGERLGSQREAGHWELGTGNWGLIQATDGQLVADLPHWRFLVR